MRTTPSISCPLSRSARGASGLMMDWTAIAMSVSVICPLRNLRSRCAAIQMVPRGPRLARMYCE